VFLIVYFILQLDFWLPEEGNYQTHALEVFNHTAHKVLKDTVSHAHIQEQCILHGRPWRRNEQEAEFFSNLLDRGAIQPDKDF
jgi:hypothetical protein